ncbi:hypothetical protein DFW101_3562 [Solidesulfovibrio carbinoliphilus subsp. oakridgensis]|uniref:Uncharacterized protein n=1 Tax=Solidesulfovibrio carbinoliphilus subsp. oakridgensis TaxID=694327 RepID=G7Q5J9_9BACT|nr:hypothetical protein [Solidesulfovibrio carbinoliphilus]EHJ49558.1 hypothetical protein DFW101_3562 [Solidesulfovibrio carbinoliphilus subsp. oakridgensis]
MSQPIEHCCVCDNPTGRAGIGEDSLYVGDDGPFCESCFAEAEHHRSTVQRLKAAEAERDQWERLYNDAAQCRDAVIKERTEFKARAEAAEDQLAIVFGLAADAEVGACGVDWALKNIRKVSFGDTTAPHPGRDWRKRAEAAEAEVGRLTGERDAAVAAKEAAADGLVTCLRAILAGHAPAPETEKDHG